MNIVVCDYCRKDGKLVEAAEVIPAMQLLLSRRKVQEIGLCSRHEEQLLPESLTGKAAEPRKQPKPQKHQPRDNSLPAVIADGKHLLTTRQIANHIDRPMKSMGYVLRNAKPVGVDRSNGTPMNVYDREELKQAGLQM